MINRVITLTTAEPINYREIYQIEPKYIGQAIAMAQVFQGALDGQTLKFDFQKAIDIVKNHPEMAVVATLNQQIQQSTAEVSVMVDKLKGLLKNVIGISLTPQQTQKFESSITEAFTNLNAQSEDAWIFWHSESGHKTTYQYNILFAIQNETTGSVMLALPMGLTITVDVEKQQVLFITLKDKHEYSVTVQAMQVVEALKN